MVKEQPYDTNNENKENIKYENFYSLINDTALAECLSALPKEECYLNVPITGTNDTPLDMQTIHEKQLDDAALLELVAKHPNHYFNKTLNEQEIICYSKKAEDRDTLFKLALPANMIAETIKWFHIVTGHPGKSKLCLTIDQR